MARLQDLIALHAAGVGGALIVMSWGAPGWGQLMAGVSCIAAVGLFLVLRDVKGMRP